MTGDSVLDATGECRFELRAGHFNGRGPVTASRDEARDMAKRGDVGGRQVVVPAADSIPTLTFPVNKAVLHDANAVRRYQGIRQRLSAASTALCKASAQLVAVTLSSSAASAM